MSNSQKGSPRYRFGEAGIAHLLLILIAAVGIIAFILFSSSTDFRSKLFSTIFPNKPKSHATEGVAVRGQSGDLWADVVLGHPDFNQAVSGEVVPFKVFNPAGVVVDRSNTPNRIYVYDGANSRILGFKSTGGCSNNSSISCTTNSDCQASTPTLPPPPPFPSDGQVAYWKMDETSGTVAADSNNNTYPFTLYNLTHISGKINNGIGIGTTPAYASVIRLPVDLSNYSVSIWFKGAISSVFQILVALSTNSLRLIMSKTDANWGLIPPNSIGLGNYAVSNLQAISTTWDAAWNNQWTLFTVTCTNPNCRLYVNGQLKANGSVEKRADPYGGIMIGSDGSVYSSVYTLGTIDEVGLWNRELTAAEVSALYNNGAGLSFPPVCDVRTRRNADIIIGQPSPGDYSGCNNDGNMENYPNRKPASASTLCSMPAIQISPGEGGSASSMFVDNQGNLYVTDFHNSRVLKYNDPFATNSDTIADGVWGQNDFTGFRCNKGGPDLNNDIVNLPPPTASSLCMGLNNNSQNSFQAGVSLDHLGNMWVADSSNNRVLRFPNQNGKLAKVADLVLGEPDFTTRSGGTESNQLSKPSVVKEGPEGKIYVADGGYESGRILVFTPPFNNGMDGRLFGSGFKPITALEFDPNGEGLWVVDTGNYQTELWNLEGTQVKKVLNKDTYQANGQCGTITQNLSCFNPRPDGSCPANLCEVYGMSIDSAGNIYETASGASQDLVRYPAPIPTPQAGKIYAYDKNFFSPPGGSNYLSNKGFYGPRGIAIYGNQLIISDGYRVMFWNDKNSLTNGKGADGFVGPSGINSFQDKFENFRVRVDKQNHLWVEVKGGIDVYQLPLTNRARPLIINGVKKGLDYTRPLPVLGSTTQQVSWGYNDDFLGIDFDSSGNLWVTQGSVGIHRALRIRNPYDNPVVDVILGQPSPTETSCNRNPDLDNYDKQGDPNLPGVAANTLCKPGAIRVDHHGNVWISDYSLEFHGNRRLLEFNASKFSLITSATVFGPNADLVSPEVRAWEMAFDSQDHMVLGLGGQLNPPGFPAVYFTLPQLSTSVIPDTNLRDLYALAISLTFDSEDNLYVADFNRGKVLIYKSIPSSSTPTSSPTSSPTATSAPTPVPDTTPPSTPTNFTATATAYNKVDLSWSPSTDNVGVVAYYVIRNNINIAKVPGSATTYSDTTVSQSTTYNYQIIALDNVANSASSDTKSVTTPAVPDTKAPSDPTNLIATAFSSSQINLSWTASTDANGVAGYDIYRNGIKLSSPVTTTSFGDTGLLAGAPYNYFVVAFDSAGNHSHSSSTVTATTQVAVPVPTTGIINGKVCSSTICTLTDGTPITYAKVSITINGITSTYVTNSSGIYSFTNLPPNTYPLSYSAKSYKTQQSSGTVSAGQTLTKNVTLTK